MNKKNVYVDFKFGSTSHTAKDWCAIALAFDDCDKIFYFERSDFDYGKAFHIEAVKNDTEFKLIDSLITYDLPEKEIKFVNDKDNFQVVKGDANMIISEIAGLILLHCGVKVPLRFYHDMTAPESLDIPALMWSVEKEMNKTENVSVYNSFYAESISLIDVSSLLTFNKLIMASIPSNNSEGIAKYCDAMFDTFNDIKQDLEYGSAIAKVACVKRIVKSVLAI